MSSRVARGSRVVFVGNVPYDWSEEQLMEIFREVGKVVGFRLVFDRDTGKPKGYGFCEFEDAETAASAVRNLNDADVGGRKLRIDYADVDPLFEGRTTNQGQVEGEQLKRPPGPRPQFGDRAPPPHMQQMQGQGAALPPNLPPGQTLPPGADASDAISQTLAALPPGKLLDIMSQMKGLVTNSPDQARALLNGNPQVAYALFQAMLMMNVVDPAILQRIIASSGAAGGMSMQQPMQPPMQPQHQQGPPHGYGAPPGPSMGYPGAMGRPMAGPPMGAYGAPPHMQQQQQHQAPPPPAVNANLPEDQKALLMQVLQLTPEQINALPEDQRASIMQLKAQLGQ